MLSYSTGLTPPSTPQDFEDLCHTVYRVAFKDPTATKNGRSGQKQHGVDVFVMRESEERYGIQCKHKSFRTLTTAIVDEEVALADSGPVRIDHLLIATTAANDAKLIAYAAALSDRRTGEGKFKVSLAFWDTFESLIRAYPELQFTLAPHQPGGAFFRTEQRLIEQSALLHQIITNLPTTVAAAAQAIPEARVESLNKLVDGQLDAVKRQIEAGRVQDALQGLASLADSLEAFDVHQRSRWYTQRAHCYWLTSHSELASKDFDEAYALTPEDEKSVANRIRGLLITDRTTEAWEAAKQAKSRFPGSRSILTMWAQVAAQVGETVHWKRDVPPEFKDDPDVLYTFGWLALVRDDATAAVGYAERACEKGIASFEAMSLRLIANVQVALENGELASVGIVGEKVLGGILDSVAFLRPFDDVLWSRQDTISTEQTVVALGYALIMLGELQEAIAVLTKVISRFPTDPQLCRVLLDAFLRNDQQEQAFAFGQAHLDNLETDLKLVVAELAANRGDLAAIENVAVSLSTCGSQDREESSCDANRRDGRSAYPVPRRGTGPGGRRLARNVSAFHNPIAAAIRIAAKHGCSGSSFSGGREKPRKQLSC